MTIAFVMITKVNDKLTVQCTVLILYIVHKNRDRPIKMQKSIEFLALYNSLNIALECPGRLTIKSCTLIERWKMQVFWGLNRSKIFYTLSPIHMSHVVIIIASCRSSCKKYIIISKKHLSFLLWILVVQPIYQKDLKMALWISSAAYFMFFSSFYHSFYWSTSKYFSFFLI